MYRKALISTAAGVLIWGLYKLTNEATPTPSNEDNVFCAAVEKASAGAIQRGLGVPLLHRGRALTDGHGFEQSLAKLGVAHVALRLAHGGHAGFDRREVHEDECDRVARVRRDGFVITVIGVAAARHQERNRKGAWQHEPAQPSTPLYRHAFVTSQTLSSIPSVRTLM
jgi:hypothetical protein